MSVRTTSGEGVVAIFDSVTGFAFGPTFESDEQAEDFLRFTADGPDLRALSDPALEQVYSDWYQSWSREQ